MDLSDAQDSSFNSDVSAPLRLLGTGEFDSLLGLYDTSYVRAAPRRFTGRTH